jgi:hypothetical protein
MLTNNRNDPFRRLGSNLHSLAGREFRDGNEEATGQRFVDSLPFLITRVMDTQVDTLVRFREPAEDDEDDQSHSALGRADSR